MFDVKMAVRVAMEFIGEMYKDENLSDVRLEEVELLEEPPQNPEWRVTVGFRTPETAAAVAESLGERVPRDYKVVKVDATSGQILGMTMRQFQS